MCALLSELSSRGHAIHVRTLSTGIGFAESLGFTADAIDPRIEAIELDDWKAGNPRTALKFGVATFGRRASHEIADLTDAIALASPNGLLIDVNCWGSQSRAEATGIPWASFAPYVPPLHSAGVPPFGLGLTPRSGAVGRIRDAAVRRVVTRPLENIMLGPITTIREDVGVPPVRSMDEFLRRSPLLLVATGTPFEYPRGDAGDAVHLIGPCELEPPPDQSTDWLAAIDRPIVLVTTSSEKQSDAGLVSTTLAALADEPFHVVATLPAGQFDAITGSANATICRFLPHGVVLDRAACAVTHGGMGATQKALAHGVPVCVVPYGRDQFEVARRVEVAGCGTRLPARKLSPRRLRTKIRDAMTMGDGARRVAAGFTATGGPAHGADLFEERVLGLTAH